MKKIFYTLLVFLLIFTCVGSTVSFAEEAAEDTVIIEDDAVKPPSEPEAEPNIFTRLYEAFTSNKTDIFTIGGSAILLVLSLILRKDVGATSKNVVDGIARVLSKTDVSNEKQDAIVGGLNEMVDGYNEIKSQSEAVKKEIDRFGTQINDIIKSNESLEVKVDHFFTIIVSLMDKEILQNAEVMEVLSSVYANNQALPQGIKDFVALKRTENAKLVQEASVLVHKDEGGNNND